MVTIGGVVVVVVAAASNKGVPDLCRVGRKIFSVCPAKRKA